MKRTLLLLALVLGMAVAEEQEEGRADVLKLAKKISLLAPLGSLFEIAIQIVILVALVLLIATLKPSVENAFGSDYDYGYATGYYPGYETSGYDVGVSGSSYTSTGGGAGGGHYKRSAETPSFMNLPIVQRLAARVHEAIENYDF
ncbi:uncharacterized protein LOC134765490 [Penaeus indicus]|uniref:uncharacterized protein LOC134765490 n=1 Tax=Penaeus indicus TaxID=29960 RepID=UPI00300CBD00